MPINLILEYIKETQDETEIARVHLSNYAADKIKLSISHGAILLHSGFEDNDLAGNAAALSAAGFAEKFHPGEYVLIDTGDAIWGKRGNRKGVFFEGITTYDPVYSLFLIHKPVWEKIKKDALEIDRKWRAIADYLARQNPGDSDCPACGDKIKNRINEYCDHCNVTSVFDRLFNNFDLYFESTETEIQK